MKKIHILLLMIVLLSTSPGILAGFAFQPTENIVVILVVDNSGSMKTSDPGDLRFTGIRLFASLLDPEDSLGLILFSTESEMVTNRLITLNSKEDVSGFLAGLRIPLPDGYTNFKAALEDAKVLLHNANQPEKKVVVVLLTDGIPEIQHPYPQYEQETLDLARSLNVPVLAIALTSAAQTPFLDRLAGITNGAVIPAANAADILNAYLQVLGQIKDRTVIDGGKFTTNGSLSLDPALVPYLNTATVVIAKPERSSLNLLGPGDLEIVDNQSRDKRYSIFTLENPAGGVYSFRLQGGGEVQAWMILHSRLRVQIVEPNNFYPMGREMPIVVNLLEEALDGNFIKIIGDVNFTALVTSPDGNQTSLDRFYDDGTHGDALAEDGNYTRLFPSVNLEGTYQISIQGWKNAIPIQGQTKVKVLRFPVLIVDAPQEKAEVRGAPLEMRVHLDISATFDQGEVVAQITSPSGSVHEQVLQSRDGTYVGEYLPTLDGTYQIVFKTVGVKYLGVDYRTQIDYSFGATVIPYAQVLLKEIKTQTACFSSSKEISFLLSVLSSQAETLRFSVPTGWKIVPETRTIKQGLQNIELQLIPVEELNPVAAHMEMRIEGSGRFEILPDANVGVDILIPNLYTRCRSQIHLSISLLMLTVVSVVTIKHVRKALLPAPVTGTLRHWAIEENPASAEETDLTNFIKQALLIGSSEDCDVTIPLANLEMKHARIVAEKSTVGVAMYFEPLGPVHKGYNLQNVRFILQHGETFRMGTHEFLYLSDHGE